MLGIWRQALASDGRLPPEKEISLLLGVGRGTVRELLTRLEAEGMVARRHGAGTFANGAALNGTVRIDRTAEYAELLARAGVRPRMEVVEAEWVELDAEASGHLGQPVRTPAFRTVKRWFADGVPVMVAVDLVAASRRAAVDPTWSVFEIALVLTRRKTDWVSSTLRATVAGEKGALLALPETEPVLCFDQLGLTREGVACWWAREHHHPTTVTYGLVRTVASDPSPRPGAGRPGR